MKKRLNLVKLTFALLAIFIMSSILMMAGVPPYTSLLIVFGASLMPMSKRGLAFAGVNQEIWTGVLVEDFRTTEEATFLNEIPDESRWVSATRGENEVIHLNDIGADPEVLINNTTYPIGMASQTDGDIPITLDKFQTKATKVTDDEMKYISYDKIRKVQEKHLKSTSKVKHQKAVHALAPAGNTANTPVLVTTGADDGTGRLRLTYADLLRFKVLVDDAAVPEDDRNLILCSDHYNDLLHEQINGNNNVRASLSELAKGNFSLPLLDFKLHRFIAAPFFDPAAKTKLAFGAVPEATDRKASVFFYAPDMFRANGSTKNYTDEPDTQTQEWRYNIRHYYIVLPRKQRAIGAIVSANAPEE